MKSFFQKKVSPILYVGVPNISNGIVKVFENCCAVYSILFLRINHQLAFSQDLLANKSSVERKIIHMCNANNENLATTKIMRMKMVLVILLVMMIETVILIKMVTVLTLVTLLLVMAIVTNTLINSLNTNFAII